MANQQSKIQNPKSEIGYVVGGGLWASQQWHPVNCSDYIGIVGQQRLSF